MGAEPRSVGRMPHEDIAKNSMLHDDILNVIEPLRLRLIRDDIFNIQKNSFNFFL